MATQPPVEPDQIPLHSPAETPAPAPEPGEPRPDEIEPPNPDVASPGTSPDEWPGETLRQ